MEGGELGVGQRWAMIMVVSVWWLAELLLRTACVLYSACTSLMWVGKEGVSLVSFWGRISIMHSIQVRISIIEEVNNIGYGDVRAQEHES